MELKVWVDGFQRIVCGVSDSTSCQDVVYALAHATGKVGRFTLIERWRSNERHLAPQENPLKILMKWGEYSSDVQFILQRSDAPKNVQSPQQLLRQQQKNNTTNSNGSVNGLSGSELSESAGTASPIERNKDVRKSLTFNHVQPDLRLADNVGVVRGVPQVRPLPLEVLEPSSSASVPDAQFRLTKGDDNVVRNTEHVEENVLEKNKMTSNQRKEAPPYREPPGPFAPPPYRDPPPPTQPNLGLPKPVEAINNQADISTNLKQHTMTKDQSSQNGPLTEMNKSLLYNVQYHDLIQLIHFQREKLTTQQANLSKYDAEIVYLESKGRDQLNQMDLIAQEIQQTDNTFRQRNEQLQALTYVEEENEIVRQQEKTLKSEITLLRSKLANCETELLQCKNKIRLLMDDVQMEQRANVRQSDNRNQLERCLLVEVERLQHDIDMAKQGADVTTQTADALKHEVAILENKIAEKKRQVERLVSEMKEANLQSLAIAPADEVKHLLEGPHKPGSSRRMIGSPRQLENAVPTNKNPHGVWV